MAIRMVIANTSTRNFVPIVISRLVLIHTMQQVSFAIKQTSNVVAGNEDIT